MIKFFRRIRQQLLTEGKFSKYLLYAIGEIVLVVIGILIALAANDWSIEKAERLQESKYLKNIKLDLEKDLASLEYNIGFRREKIAGTEKLIAQINGTPVDDLTELSRNVFNTLNEERFTPNNSTYTELASSGNLNLISVDSIKILLLELEELYKDNAFGIDHETYEYREYISKPVFKYTDTEKLAAVFIDGQSSTQQDISREDFQALFQSPEYKNGLVIMILISKSFINQYKEIADKSKMIITLIDRELSRRDG